MRIFLCSALALVLSASCAHHAHGAAAVDTPRWIRGGATCEDSVYLRKSFFLNQTPARATASIDINSATYFLDINGVRAAQAYAGTWDVTRLLKRGENVVAALLRAPDKEDACAAALLFHLDMDTEAGGHNRIVSDGTWKALPGTDWMDSPDDGASPAAIYDARRAPRLGLRPVDGDDDRMRIFMSYVAWNEPGYDDGAWIPAAEGAVAQAQDARPAPGHSMPVRVLPQAVELCIPDTSCEPVVSLSGSSSKISARIPNTGAGTLFITFRACPGGAVWFTFSSGQDGAAVTVAGIGQYIARKGLQQWDVPAAPETVRLSVSGAVQPVFLLDSGIWCAGDRD